MDIHEEARRIAAEHKAAAPAPASGSTEPSAAVPVQEKPAESGVAAAEAPLKV